MNLKKYLAEMFGTFVLVFAGTAVATSTGNALYTALAFGLVVIAMAYSIGSISGAHLNPAVSFGLALNKRITWKDFGFYVLFQIIGALLASLLLSLVLGSRASLAGNQAQTAISQNLWFALIIEIVITAVFLFVILSVTSKKENDHVAGFVIAFTLAVMILTSFNLSSAGLNPARSIAPALLEGGGALDQLWVFIVGPLVGAFLGQSFFKFLNNKITI
ncbi:MAG: aquaporin [Acholeplasmataceae bacterium]